MLPRLVFLTAATLTLSACGASAASPDLSIPHPDDASKQVEYFLEQPAGHGPWPTMVLLHGHQEGSRPGGKDFVDWGVLKQMANRGYLAVSVSQPGYGNSSGPADFSGPSTQHAVSAVIAKLRADGLASRERLVIQGISRGALVAGLIAAQDPSISGLVLISGVYDVPAYVADSHAGVEKAAVIASIIAETGGMADALMARSLLRPDVAINASVLILNGAQDDRTDPDQARAFARHVARGGGNARAIIYADVGHRIPIDVRSKDIDSFIDGVLNAATACTARACS